MSRLALPMVRNGIAEVAMLAARNQANPAFSTTRGELQPTELTRLRSGHQSRLCECGHGCRDFRNCLYRLTLEVSLLLVTLAIVICKLLRGHPLTHRENGVKGLAIVICKERALC